MLARRCLRNILLKRSAAWQVTRSYSSLNVATVDLHHKNTTKELFNYTSGRWIYNDELRHREREKHFDVAELKRLAARSISRSPDDVCNIRKLAEGGFNRTFEISMRDGFRMVARIPYPTLVPRSYAVASEVASMTFLREHGLPVPEIYAYSSTSKNAVNTEYIFMEYAKGVNLGGIWFELEQVSKIKILDQVIKLEARLCEVKLPAYGSIYFKDDLPTSVQSIDAGKSKHGRTFCVGPDTALALWYGRRSSIDVDRGPFRSPIDAISNGADKEISYLKKFGRPLLPYNRMRRETFDYAEQDPAVHIDSLQKYKRLAPAMLSDVDTLLADPIMRHPDLQPNNIFVTNDLELSAIIDWQHMSTLPMFVQAGIPKLFSNFNDAASRSLDIPRLPSNMADMTAEEQYEALEIFNKQQLHYEYVSRTHAMAGKHSKALAIPFVRARRYLYELSCNPWEADNMSLRSSLVSMIQNWPSIFGDTNCPISFAKEEQHECLRLERDQQEADAILQLPRDLLEIGPDGWVPNDQYDRVMAGLAAFKDEALKSADSDHDRSMILAHWPFDDMDEEPYL